MVKRFLYSAGLGVAILLIAGFWFIKQQGSISKSTPGIENLSWGDYGIPTVTASSWEEAVRSQGMAVASLRLWQMDLIRRQSAGRLHEWFGEGALELDLKRLRQDREHVADLAVNNLPPEELKYCQAYAQGVNDFISHNSSFWGIEYLLLGKTPEPWTCRDSILILLEMSEQMTNNHDIQAKASWWTERLPESWRPFLFPQSHPWNKPLFGQSSSPKLPPKADWLPPGALGEPLASSRALPQADQGSNNWAYRGNKGWFLANDPHLEQMVPGQWVPVRMFVSKEEWVVGCALPGVPLPILAMNPYVGWSFTNLAENVDELIKEELDAKHENYLDYDETGKPVWRKIKQKQVVVNVKGVPRTFTFEFTHRGPLEYRNLPSPGYYSQQWLALDPSSLRMPTMAFAKAKTIKALDLAIDDFLIPAQNVVFMDRLGGMGYRSSGRGIKREKSLYPRVAGPQGSWQGYEPKEQRRRLFLAPDSSKHFLATANARIWGNSQHFHYWSDANRETRLETALRDKDLSAKDMIALQLDDYSRFRQFLLRWVSKHKDLGDLGKHWQEWDGCKSSDPLSFAHSEQVEQRMFSLLLHRVKQHFFTDSGAVPEYSWNLDRAWLLTVLQSDHGLEVFGLKPGDIIDYLVRDLSLEDDLPLPQRWRAQHPFVKRVPVLGLLFTVNEPLQSGAPDVLNAAGKKTGPSVRLLWRMDKPWESSWIFPVGVSGHIGKNFDSMQKLWHSGQQLQVFSPEERARWFED